MQANHGSAGLATEPRQDRRRPDPRTSVASHAETVTEAIYLVGDDPSLRRQLSSCSSLTGKTVIAFSGANDYLTFAFTETAACVVINSNIPDMCGLEFQCRLASTPNPPVIFISDQPDVPMTVCAMKAGAIDVLNKPLDLSKLTVAIHAGLKQDRKLRQRRAELASLQARFGLLTPREREVLPLVIGGLLNKQAAGLLGISEITLQIHRGQVMRKMQAHSLADLVRMAMRLKLPYWDSSKRHETAADGPSAERQEVSAAYHPARSPSLSTLTAANH